MRSTTLSALALVTLFAGWLTTANAERLPVEAINTTTIVLPGQSPGPEDDTLVAVFFPDLDAQFPTAVALQGGLVAGAEYSEFAIEVARHGYLVAVPNRLTLLGPPPPVPFPDQIVVLEVLAQLALENANPASALSGRVDTSRMGLLGHSVGGFVGLLVIEGSCVPPFCFPPFPFVAPPSLRAGAFYGTNSFDPITGQLIDIETGDTPVALINGSLDSISTPEDAEATLSILDGPSELIIIDGANHFGIANQNNPPGAQPDLSVPTISQTSAITEVGRAAGEFLQDEIFNLAVSKSRNRSDALPLQGTSLDNKVRIFLSPVRPRHDIDEVDFYLDGSFVRTEFFAPYDLKGTFRGKARSLQTFSLANGQHEVRADIVFTSGEIRTESASFEVANEVFGLSVSTATDRSNAVPLGGQALSGEVHIFVTPIFPDTPIKRVKFFLDNSYIKTEFVAPYDLKGTTSSGARPLDTSGLSNGAHTITAEIKLNSHFRLQVIESFTVNNAQP